MIRSIVQFLLTVLFILTPVFSIFEISGYLSISLLNIDLAYIKLPKDILLLITFFFSFIRFIQKKYPFYIMGNFLFLFFYTILCFLIVSFSSLYLGVSGLRWALPLFLIFVLYDIIDYNFMRRVAKILAALIVLNLALQIYEMLFMPSFWGLNMFGFTGRLPGFFAQASICGLFGCFCFFFIRYFYKKGWKRKVLLAITVTSIFLTMSSAGYMILMALLLTSIFLKSKFKPLLLLLSVAGMIFIFTSMDSLTGRGEGDTASSGSTRVGILANEIMSAGLISDSFGKATNTAKMVETIWADDESFIADSFYISLLTNYGYIFFLVFILIVTYIFIKMKLINNTSMRVFFVLALMSGISTIVVELFPMSILISVSTAYYLKYGNKENTGYSEDNYSLTEKNI